MSATADAAAPALFAFDDEALGRLATQHGTPCFVHRTPLAEQAFAALRAALPPGVRVAYAVKANPHPLLLARLARLGASFDCASAGELRRAAEALAAAGDPPAAAPGGSAASRLLFAGPGKQEAELALAVQLGARVQAEGWEDLQRLAALAGGQELRVNLRVHPASGVDEERPILGGAGPSAFGVDEEDVPALLRRAAGLQGVRLRGLHVFAASNERDAGRLLATHAMVMRLGQSLQRALDAPLEQVDLGGGLGVPYAAGEAPLDVAALGRGLAALRREHAWFTGELLLEPGRFVAAACGVYLSRVVRVKISRGVRFVVLQAGLNHLLRPRLTGQPFPVRLVGAAGRGELRPATLAGPLCTSLDRLGEVELPAELRAGDLLAFGMAGAYGATEAMPRFLSHPEAAEIWLD